MAKSNEELEQENQELRKQLEAQKESKDLQKENQELKQQLNENQRTWINE